MTPLLTQAEVAALLSISERTVQDWRYGRTGPPYITVGRLVRYSQEDVEAWVESKPRRHRRAHCDQFPLRSGIFRIHAIGPDRRRGPRWVQSVPHSFRLYDLRHTWATRAIESGADVPTVAAMLWHSGMRTIFRYVHPTAETKKAAMERFEAAQQRRKFKVVGK